MRPDLIPDNFFGKLVRAEEECAEVIKAASKILRFGYTPTDAKTGITYDNIADLRYEILDAQHALGDLQAALEEPLPDRFTIIMREVLLT